jgi:ribosomal protein S18 acetylase RimI-like enzyme
MTLLVLFHGRVERAPGMTVRMRVAMTTSNDSGTAGMFASSPLARRIEAAEASLTFDVGHTVQRRYPERAVIVARFGGGVGVFAGDSPFDKVIGVGFQALDLEELGAFERAVFARGGRVQVELSTLADPGLATTLTARGYMLCGFENVLGRAVEPAMGAVADDSVADDSVAEISPGEGALWIATVAGGFVDPDGSDGPASHESFARDALDAVLHDMENVVGYRRFLARIAGDIAGGASMRIHDGIAQLTGAATLARYRRRGVQTALLRVRLAVAARAGCDLAVVTTQPGSRSQQNVMRAGFSLLYSRAILRRGARDAPVEEADGGVLRHVGRAPPPDEPLLRRAGDQPSCTVEELPAHQAART